jgi:hypothetical protein
MAKSPQADRATREKVSKILPLLNSDNEGERQAAAEALRKLDLLGASAVLQATIGPINGSFARAFDDAWRNNYKEQERKERVERLGKLQAAAQRILDANSPLLTNLHRKSLSLILALQLPDENDFGWRTKFYTTLEQRERRLADIQWQIFPGAVELEKSVKGLVEKVRGFWLSPRDVLHSKSRTEMLEHIQSARDALQKVAAQIAALGEGDVP